MKKDYVTQNQDQDTKELSPDVSTHGNVSRFNISYCTLSVLLLVLVHNLTTVKYLQYNAK